jgi:pyruvate dehydrogenase E1 component
VYEPAFAAELAVILDHGMRRMLEDGEDAFYYLTATNENYAQLPLPRGAQADVIRGMYRIGATDPEDARARVRLLGSGPILCEVIAAAQLLAQDWGVASETWSVTSYSELARESHALQRRARLNPLAPAEPGHAERCLSGDDPVIAASDWVRAWPQLIAGAVRARFTVLGTDGFGRSDTRQALREFFEVDRHQIVVAALHALALDARISPARVAEAIARYGIRPVEAAPWER